jgi:hypothetical protein
VDRGLVDSTSLVLLTTGKNTDSTVVPGQIMAECLCPILDDVTIQPIFGYCWRHKPCWCEKNQRRKEAKTTCCRRFIPHGVRSTPCCSVRNALGRPAHVLARRVRSLLVDDHLDLGSTTMKRLLLCQLVVALTSSLDRQAINAFVVQPRNGHKNGPGSSSSFTITTTRRTNEVLSAELREYVPLIVSGAVIIDILAGSPFVNAVMSFARPKDEEEEAARTSGGNNNNNIKDAKERIDSKKVAAAAVERAQNVVAIRQMLEDNKTRDDRIKDLQRKVEQQQAEFDRERKNRSS